MILLFFLSPGGGFRSRRPPPLAMLLGILPWLRKLEIATGRLTPGTCTRGQSSFSCFCLVNWTISQDFLSSLDSPWNSRTFSVMEGFYLKRKYPKLSFILKTWVSISIMFWQSENSDTSSRPQLPTFFARSTRSSGRRKILIDMIGRPKFAGKMWPRSPFLHIFTTSEFCRGLFRFCPPDLVFRGIFLSDFRGKYVTNPPHFYFPA